ncbi:DUF4166 domain-containing protein [Chengkuizengella axinellae]|uniref:DUF4166 domain-containing protein n=1 Tax=Chengkuizengella axinellae TaxID=3064388 RepID=A0ABT9IY07_9BACL|nr:DUF4166 domain-containing protein [Chengkuizengella sp. 2205SS18-9]MDP5274249.1 DUF4166 domain-containing protein [Chengkuizengella sp. 2205SS18-9]
MNIYQQLLGQDFQLMHPMLQKRYLFADNEPFEATGVMENIHSKKWLSIFLRLSTKWKFLFPEHGGNIPFSIRNSVQSGTNNAQEIHWQRSFYFPKVTRHFNALMSIDPDKKVVKDYLGEPHLFYSDLNFQVAQDGRLFIHSGRQKLVVGKLEIPLPRWMEGRVEVEEGYDDFRNVYTIQVSITNSIIGRLIAYEGYFKSKTSS